MDRMRRQRKKQQQPPMMLGSPQGVELKSMARTAADAKAAAAADDGGAKAVPGKPSSNVGVSLLDIASPEPPSTASPEEILQDLQKSSPSSSSSPPPPPDTTSFPDDEERDRSKYSSVRRELQLGGSPSPSSTSKKDTTTSPPPPKRPSTSMMTMKRPPRTPETRRSLSQQKIIMASSPPSDTGADPNNMTHPIRSKRSLATGSYASTSGSRLSSSPPAAGGGGNSKNKARYSYGSSPGRLSTSGINPIAPLPEDDEDETDQYYRRKQQSQGRTSHNKYSYQRYPSDEYYRAQPQEGSSSSKNDASSPPLAAAAAAAPLQQNYPSLMDDSASMDTSSIMMSSPMSKVSVASGGSTTTVAGGADDQSIRRPFKKQVRELNTLLTSPELRLGPLASTTKVVASPDEEDDYLDMEMEDVAKSQQALQAELAAAELSMVVPTPESIPEFTPSPQQQQQQHSNDNNPNDISALASPDMDLSSRAYKSSSSSSEGKGSSSGSSSFVKRHLFQSSSESGSSPSSGEKDSGRNEQQESPPSAVQQGQKQHESASTPELVVSESPELLRAAHREDRAVDEHNAFFLRLFEQQPEKEIVFDDNDDDNIEVDVNDDDDDQWVHFVPPSPIQQASPSNSARLSRSPGGLSTGDSFSVKDPSLSLVTTPDSKLDRNRSLSLTSSPAIGPSEVYRQSKSKPPTPPSPAENLASSSSRSTPDKYEASSAASSPTYVRVRYLNDEESSQPNDSMASSSVYLQENSMDQQHVHSMSLLSGGMSMEQDDIGIEVDHWLQPTRQPVTPLADSSKGEGVKKGKGQDSMRTYREASQEIVYSEDLLQASPASPFSPIVKRYPKRDPNKSRDRTNMMYSENLLSPTEPLFQSPPPFFSPPSGRRIQIPENPPTIVSHAATVTPDHAANMHSVGAFSPPDPVCWPEDEYPASPFEDRDPSFDDTRKDRQPLFPSFGARSDEDPHKMNNWLLSKSPIRRRGYASFSEDEEDQPEKKVDPSASSSSWISKMISALRIQPFLRDPAQIQDKSSAMPDHVPLDSPQSFKDSPLGGRLEEEIDFFDITVDLDKNLRDDSSDDSNEDRGDPIDIYRGYPLPSSTPAQEDIKEAKQIFKKEVNQRTRICYLIFFFILLALAGAIAIAIWLENRNDDDGKSTDELSEGNSTLQSATPTLYPTLSNAPTTSTMPSNPPSVSMEPTISMSPSTNPSVSPSDAPTSPDVIVSTVYHIFVENGNIDNILSLRYRLNLIEAMDLLAFQVFDSLVDEDIRRKLFEILSVPTLKLPTAITSIVEIPCPEPTSDDRCEEVVADILLYSGSSISDVFKNTLEVGIELGGLQFFLDDVNPDSPVTIIDMDFKSPTLSPSHSPSKVTPSPSQLPTLDPTTSPTHFPSPSPSFDISLPPDQLPLFTLLVDNSFDKGAALIDPSSPQHRAFQWLATDERLLQYSEKRILQRYVFATLYFSTNGDGWSRNDRWLSEGDECDWYSKTGRRDVCNPSGTAVSLELDFNNLQGTLPPELGLLSDSLVRLDLGGGPDTFISGTIPSEYGALSNLKVLRLLDNRITGTIPLSISSWTKLEDFDVSNNQLSGQLPNGVSFLTAIKIFDMSTNRFEGSLPSEIGMMTNCRVLSLENNLLSGAFPSEIGFLTKLQDLLAGSNAFTFLPSEIGELQVLGILSFAENNIAGTLATSIGTLFSLRHLELHDNNFEGDIPSELGNLRDIRHELDLSHNGFQGQIPSELGRLNQLRILRLNRNRLTGTVPKELSNLSKLTVVRMDSNELVGSIPEEVCDIFEETVPAFYSDCSEFNDDCACCTHCCSMGLCGCRYEGALEYLCFQSRVDEDP